MSDIVERLESISPDMANAAMLREAADEIATLRAEVERLQDLILCAADCGGPKASDADRCDRCDWADGDRCAVTEEPLPGPEP